MDELIEDQTKLVAATQAACLELAGTPRGKELFQMHAIVVDKLMTLAAVKRDVG